ncbi:NAD-dependent epimerase/dehydratase family protein [Anaeromicrobium sediminis]|uniref:NAD-dependent epimerase/dehydratase domain-containing protein n=1 Tax=Anaeromicrobium sediminis TaxID=1478221 RepID=A0A267MFR4_9FIRM|nr:NAD-dependent epimerase/dehydratase family protein [Anaeromicrobium sediminis]PAB57748.1 hypothetical protein CCE28_18165 [Anaeromicrobium sediminis]
MKVLITGGYGFIGSHVADRFYKEGHEVYIIDNLSTGKAENVEVKHKFYKLGIEDKKCEEIFKVNKFHVVINLAAQVDVNMSLKNPRLDAQVNIMGLVNMLELSAKYGVKKFIFASSAAVYGDNETLPLTEKSKISPISPYGISKLIGEYYCIKWNEIYGLNTIAFRFSNVYGPRQGVKGEAGVVSIFLKKLMKGDKLTVFGDGEQTRDYIYVEDVVDGIYKSTMVSNISGVYNLSTNTEKSLNDLLEVLKSLESIEEILYGEKRKGDILHSRLDNTRVKKDLNWRNIYSLEEGLSKTYEWYRQNCKLNHMDTSKEVKGKNKKKRFNRLMRILLPYAENILIFIILFYMCLKGIGTSPLNNDLYTFSSIIYIGLMGILYGKKQSSISIFLSIILYVFGYLRVGGDIIVLFYEPKHLIIIAIYVLIGTTTGYVLDKKNRVLDFKDLEIEALKEKYSFLYEIYGETRELKDEFEKQIINSKDSFGKIYSIVEQLKYLQKEKVYSGCVGVIESIMETDEVGVYTASHKGEFLRLKAKSRKNNLKISNSIDLGNLTEIKNMIEKKEIFINNNLNPNLPIMAAPIVKDNRVFGIIAIYKVKFEKLTLYYENLFKILTGLISDSLSMAYVHEQSIMSEKYIEDTFILKTNEFESVLETIKQKYEKFNMDYLLLKINTLEPYKKISGKLKPIIRADDYIGLGKDNKLYLLLTNAKVKDMDIISHKLKRKGIHVSLVQGGQYVE